MAYKPKLFPRLLQRIEVEVAQGNATPQTHKSCAIACILLFAIGLTRYWVSYNPSGSVHRNPESLSLACSLYYNGQFANPFEALTTGPSAHLAPVFPAFLALLMKIFGPASVGLYAMQLAAALILSFQLALFPVFSRMLGMGILNGFLAASIWIVAKVENSYKWESFYVSLLLAVACCSYRRYLNSSGREATKFRWILGCLMGLLILTAPTVASIFAIWLFWEIWRRRSSFWKESLLPLVLLPALVITPWMMRNYRLFHHYVFVRDDLGLELSVSNNDCAEFSISLNNVSGCFFKTHPNISVDEAERVSQLGEVEYNKSKLRDALRWITDHPARFMKLTAMRFVVFWLPNESGKIFLAARPRLPVVTPKPTRAATTGDNERRRFERAIIYLMTILSAIGLIILHRQDFESMAVCLSCLAAFPMIYYIVEFEDRYRYPILWVTFLLGSLPITTLIKRIHTSRALAISNGEGFFDTQNNHDQDEAS